MANIKNGYEELSTLIKNLNGSLNMVEHTIDITSYRRRLKDIKEAAHKDNFRETKMVDGLKDSYDFFSLSPYIEQVKDLQEELDKKVKPFYEAYLLTEKINQELANINQENADKVLGKVVKLIDVIKSLNANDNKDFNKIINGAYNCIYRVLFKERRLNRSDVLNHTLVSGNDALKESLGRLMENDVKTVDPILLRDTQLEHMDTEGLSFDHLTPEILDALLNNKSLERRNRANSAYADFQSRFESQKKELDIQYGESTEQIRNLRCDQLKDYVKRGSLLLIPLVTLGIGYLSGTALSNKIDTYRTTTRTINYQTNQTIGKEDVIYSEKESMYTATILINSPWSKKPYGTGYSRSVVAYEYIKDDEELSIERIRKNNREKYKYIEYANTIPAGENTTDAVIYVTETIQDKSDSKKSTKFVIPFSIVAFMLGCGIDFLLTGFNHMHYSMNSDKEEQLTRAIRAKFKAQSAYVTLCETSKSMRESMKNKYGPDATIPLPEIPKKLSKNRRNQSTR